MFIRRAPKQRPDTSDVEPGDGPYVRSERGGTARRVLTIPLAVALAALLSATFLAAGGDDPVAGVGAGAAAAPAPAPAPAAAQAPAPGAVQAPAVAQAPAAASGEGAACDEATLRAAIDASGAVNPDMVYEIAYLECADGYGWATLTNDMDGATVFLTVSDAGMTLIDLGTGICAPEDGIPADVAAKIAPPGEDPTGGCEVQPATPIETEAHFTG